MIAVPKLMVGVARLDNVKRTVGCGDPVRLATLSEGRADPKANVGRQQLFSHDLYGYFVIVSTLLGGMASLTRDSTVAGLACKTDDVLLKG